MSKSFSLLFLDFDGVTHPLVGSPMFMPECMNALATAIGPYELEIVVASSWRETYSREELESKLSSLGKKIQGITPMIDDPFLKHIRYHEVKQYLNNTNQEDVSWIALDDTGGFYPEEAPVYWTSSKTGFTIEDIDKLRTMITIKLNDS